MKALTFPSPSTQPNQFVTYLSRKLFVNLKPEHALQTLKDLSDALSSRQKENLLDYLTSHMQLSHVQSLRLASQLHTTLCKSFADCNDFVTWLPWELVLRIFSYLPLDTLIACSLVNHSWLRVSRSPELYRRLCSLPEWSPPNIAESHTSIDLTPSLVPSMERSESKSDDLTRPVSLATLDDRNEQAIDWLSIFKKRLQLRRNWLLGKHRVRRFTGHSEAVHCVAYDAYRIVSGSADATIRVWNVRTNANWSVQTLRGHSDAVRCLQLLPVPSDSPPTSPLTPTSPTEDLISCWHPPEVTLISGSSDTTIKLWRLSTTMKWSRIACTSTLQGHTDTVRCLQADQRKLLSGSYDCTLRLWDLETKQLKSVFRGHAAGVVCLTYDEHVLYSGSLDKTVRIWCLSSSRCLYILSRSMLSPSAQFWLTPVSSLHLDVVRNRLLIAHQDGVVLVWNRPSPSNGGDVSRSQQPCHHVTDAAVSVYLTEQFDPAAMGHAGAVIRCISGDRWHIVCGSDDKTLKIWRADNNKLVNILHGHEDGITCAVVTGSVIVSGSYDKTVLLYDFDIT